MTRSTDQILRAATTTLAAAGLPDAATDARSLLADALGVARDRLILLGPDPVPQTAIATFEAALLRRIAGEPVARIIGRRLFWGRPFVITPAVLDPRADTETLIATALQGPAPAQLLDLGTGSGAIALTLLAEWPQARAVATDISPAALQVAAQNADHLGVTARLTLTQSDWFSHVTGRFDLIVSNPPYIAAAELDDLSPEVRNHDPLLALSPGGDGLQPYRLIAAQAGAHLTDQGRLILEIGWQQGDDVMAILSAEGWQDVQRIPDLEGRDRVILGRKPPQAAILAGK